MIWDDITKGWKNTFNFSGRATRTEFWGLVVSGMFVFFLFTLISAAIPVLGSVLLLIFFLLFAVASLSVTIRRTRDTGNDAWVGVLLFLTGIFALIIGFFPSKNPEAADSISNHQQKASPEIKDFHYTPEYKAKSDFGSEHKPSSSRPAAARLPLKDFN